MGIHSFLPGSQECRGTLFSPIQYYNSIVRGSYSFLPVGETESAGVDEYTLFGDGSEHYSYR